MTLIKIIKNVSCISLMFIGGCTNNQPKTPVVVDDHLSEMNAAQNERDSIEQLYMSTLNEIDNSLDLIFNNAPKESKEGRSANNSLVSRKEDILKNIQLAGSMLDERKEKINRIKSQLSKYKKQNAGLNKRLEESLTKIDEYEKQLSALQQQITDKNTEITELNSRAEKLKLEGIMQKEFADKFETDLNTAYYAKGTAYQLKQAGIVVKKGGVLGIGRTEELSEVFPEEIFTKIDIRQTTSFPVNAKKAKLVTTHPEHTYEFKESGGQIASLEIKNPKEFWKISKHLVVEVKE